MFNLLSADFLEKIPVWAYIVGGIVAVIVFGLIMHFSNRSFRIKYDMSLYGGGLLMLITIAAVFLGIFVFQDNMPVKIGCFVGAGVLALITIIYDIKKCGGAGVLAFFLQIIFCVGSLFVVIDFFKGNNVSYYNREDRVVRDRRRDRGYDK